LALESPREYTQPTVQEIPGGSEESRAIEQIRHQMKEEDLQAERNASAATELSASAEQVASTAQELAEISRRLAETVSRFTV
jgi:methyl-accepting chemotaxis protein